MALLRWGIANIGGKGIDGGVPCPPILGFVGQQYRYFPHRPLLFGLHHLRRIKHIIIRLLNSRAISDVF